MSLQNLRVLVCGGRDFDDPPLVAKMLAELDPLEIITGDASGADTLAAQWADANGVAVQRFQAWWKQFGKFAGPQRNKRMLEQGRPELVVAFPGGRGTAHMVSIAEKAGVPVITPKSFLGGE